MRAFSVHSKGGGGGYNLEIGNVRLVTVIQTVVGIYIEKVLGIRPFAIHQMKHVTFKNMTYLDGLPSFLSFWYLSIKQLKAKKKSFRTGKLKNLTINIVTASKNEKIRANLTS